MGQSILVTGGAGYIGTHTVLQLLLGGYKVVVVHDLDNFSDVALQGVKELAGDHGANLVVIKLDLCDKRALEEVFSSTNFDSVLHFAGLKVVAGSRIPFYPRNCLIGTYVLLAVMAEHGCKKLVFSSSATFYERCNTHYVEEICRDVYKSDPGWNVIVLRYSNPSGHIGEDPRGIPNSLMPFVQQVVVERRPTVTVDGVGDYIHVITLADGHIAAVRKLGESDEGCEVYNLSPKNGTLELEMVAKDKRPWDEGADLRKAMIRGHVDGYEYVCEKMEEMEKQVNEKPEYANMVSFKAVLDSLKLAFKVHEEAVRKMTQDRVSLGNRRFKNEEEKNEFTALIVENMPVCFHLQLFPAAPLGKKKYYYWSQEEVQTRSTDQ